MPFFAEVNVEGVVERVVVASSIAWVQSYLSTEGTWVETTNDLDSEQYPGPGWTWDGAQFSRPSEEQAPTEEP